MQNKEKKREKINVEAKRFKSTPPQVLHNLVLGTLRQMDPTSENKQTNEILQRRTPTTSTNNLNSDYLLLLGWQARLKYILKSKHDEKRKTPPAFIRTTPA